jgi:WD40 repeat protein
VAAPIQPPMGMVIPSVSFTADSRSLILFTPVHGHGDMAVVDLASRTVRATLRTAAPQTSISSVAASSDGRRIVTVVTTGQGKATTAALQQWQTAGLQRLPGSQPVSAATTLRPLPDGAVLATSPKGVTVWGPQLDRPRHSYPVPAPISGLSDDGRTVAAVDGAHVRLLDLSTGSVTAVPSVKSPAFDGLVVFTPDKSGLAGTGAHGTVRLLNVASGAVTVIGHESGLRADVVGAGDAAYTVSLDSTAMRWSLSGGRFAPHFTVAPNGDGTDDVAVSSRGIAATVAGPSYQSVTLWNLATHKAVGSPMSAGPGSVGWVAFSPDGRELAIVNRQNGNVAIWDVASGRQVATLHQARPQPADAIAWSPDGRLIATGSIVKIDSITFKHGHVTVWNVASRHVVDRWAQPQDAGISTVTFDDSGTELASVGEAGTVALFDITHHSLARTWNTSDDFTFSAAFQPGTTTIATGGAGGGLVTLWNSSSGQAIPPPITSRDATAPVGFVNNDSEVVVARAPLDCHCAGSVQVWDVGARQLIANLPVRGGWPGTAVEPGSDDVITTSYSGLLTTWHMSPTEWVSDACAIANRNLTRAEWQAYLGDLPYEATCR